MNMPGFNADATLYKTSERYQTIRDMINLPTQMIYPAEVIEVHGCPPGSSLWEDGGDWGCTPDVGVDPGSQPPGGQPPGGQPPGGGGGGGSGTPPPPPPPKPPPRPPLPPLPPQPPKVCSLPPLVCGGSAANRVVFPGCRVTCGPGETAICWSGDCLLHYGPRCGCVGPYRPSGQ